MRRILVFPVLIFLLVSPLLPGKSPASLNFNPPPLSELHFRYKVGSGARAFGMAGAFIAVADDATAASWNPGGLGQLEKPEFSFVYGRQGYVKMRPARADQQTFLGAQNSRADTYGFDFISFTYPMKIGNLKIVPQLSYQRGINFKLETEMNDVVFNSRQYDPLQQDFVDFQGTFTEEHQFDGGVDCISFSIGTKLFNRVNIGVSTNLWVNGFEGERSCVFTGTALIANSPAIDYRFDYSEGISMDFNGLNFSAGLLVEITENFKFGAVYKSPFSARVNHEVLQAHEVFVSGVTQESELYRVPGKSKVKWPDTWGVGVSLRPIDPLTISADLTKTNWSRAIIRDFTFIDRTADIYFPSFIPVAEETRKQMAARQFRLGLEYVLIGRKVLVPLRCGFFTDSRYVSDLSGEKIPYFGFTAGLGVKKDIFSVDIALLYSSGRYLGSNLDYSVTRFSETQFYVSTIFSL